MPAIGAITGDCVFEHDTADDLRTPGLDERQHEGAWFIPPRQLLAVTSNICQVVVHNVIVSKQAP